jgi:hypothetical protein
MMGAVERDLRREERGADAPGGGKRKFDLGLFRRTERGGQTLRAFIQINLLPRSH